MITRLGTWSPLLVAGVVVAAAWSRVSVARAQSTDIAPQPRADSAEAGYRRVFVPADRPDEWPTGGDRYLPINREQFERLATAASQRSALGQGQGAQIASASYSARLEQNVLVGDLTYEVRLIDELPEILPLTQLNLAVSDPQWAGEGEGSGRKALVGLWDRSPEQAATPGVLVEQSGQFTAKWIACEDLAASAEQAFRLRLPPALKQEFVVDLPADHTASMLPSSPVDIDPVEGSSLRRWSFKLAPAGEYSLRITPTSSRSPRQSILPLVAVSESYAVTPRSVEYEAKFRVQRQTAEQAEFSVGIPAGLRITEAFVDGKAVNWAVHQDDDATANIKLPPSSSPINAVFRATGPVVLGDSWRLPRIVPRQAFDTEGATTLWIDPALEVQSITPLSATLVNQVGVGALSEGEAYRLQHLSSDAVAEVILAERTAKLRAETGTVAEFADRELAGRCHARLWAAGAGLYHIQAALAPEWDLESVEATPPETIAEWHVAGAGLDRRLHLQLRRTPTEEEPLHLAITARKPLRGWAPTATLGELAWIHFLGAEEDDRPLLVADRRRGEITASRQAQSASRALSSLVARERQLLGEPTSGLLLSADKAPPEATIKIVVSPPRFQAEAWIELTRAEAGFQHQAQILCKPQEGAISALTVATARPLPADAQWILASTGEQLSAERADGGGAGEGAEPTAGGVAYRLRLPKAQTDAFRLRITWYGEGAAQESIVSISLPEADNWMAWAVLRGNPAMVRVNPNGVTPASVIPHDETADKPPVVGCFRLGDDPSAPAAVSPSLVADPSLNALGADGVTCWACDVTTLQFPDGRQSHRIVYELESTDASSSALEAPGELRIVSARLDGRVIASSAELQASRRLNIPLATRGKRHRLVIDLQGTRPRLSATTRLPIALPQTSFDVVRARWTLCVPAPYAVNPAYTRDAAGWRQRLFGPLVVAPGDSPPRVDANPSFGAAEGAADAAHPRAASFIPARWSKESQLFVNAPAPMEIRRLDESRAAWHAAWLAATVVAGLLWPVRSRWVVMGAIATAVACLVLPLSSLAIPQAIFLGTLSGTAVREVLARTAKPTAGARSQAMSRAALLTLSLWFLPGAGVVHANDSDPPPAVLYPIDERGERDGDDVYAPANLLNDLLPSTLQSRYDGATSLLRGANYLIELSDNADGTVLCESASLRFGVQTFRRGVRVSLPLVRGQAQWIDADHTLDGQPIKLDWNSTGNGCSLLVNEPGVHELVLQLKPQTMAVGAKSRVSLSVPPLPGAVVKIDHPLGVDELSINSTAMGAGAAQATRAVLTLPASERLNVAWPSRLKKPSTTLTIDQLSWLKVAPSGVQLEVRLSLAGDLSGVETLELNTPPQLKLLTPPEESSLFQVSGEPGVTELRLAAPVRAPWIASLQFQLPRSVALGNVDFPIVTPMVAAGGNRQFAVSVDPRLRASTVSSGDLTSLPVAEVERLWGPLGAEPAIAYSATGDEPHWAMQVAPAPEQVVSRETMELMVAADHAAVSYAAAIESAPDGVLLHRLNLPPELRVKAVAIDSDDGAETLRWSRPRPEELNVFLGQPLNGPHRLTLEGELPHDGSRLSVPQLRLEHSTAGPLAVTVLRDSEVLVEPVGDNAPLPSSPVIRRASPTELVVGKYALARDAAIGPRFRISRNDAQLEAAAVVTIDLAGPKPVANIAIHGRVARGVVDRVRLSISKSFLEPVTTDSSVEAMIKPAPGDPERQLLEATLPKVVSAGEEFLLKLTGELAPGTDQRLRFPQLRVLDAPTQELFLLLPKAPSGQTAEWTLRRLQQADLPKSLAEVLGIPASTVAYRAQGDRFVAEQRVFPVALRTATIRLADSHVTIDSQGDWSAVSQLIIQPGGGSDISLSIPRGAELLHAAVDEHPIPAAAGATTVRVPAGSRYLPRIVRIAYRRGSDGNRDIELEAPQVKVDGKPIAIGRALWGIEGERAKSLVVAGAGGSLSLEAHDQAVRREYLSTVLVASTLALQLPEWELHNWFHPWLTRLEPEGILDAAAAKDADEVAWRTLHQRITTAEPYPRAAEKPASNDALQPDVTAATAWYRGGPNGQLTLTPAREGVGAGRWLLAVALVALGGATWRFPRFYEQALARIRRWPGAIGVAVGLAWWWLLTPSSLGLAIIALSLAALIKTRKSSPESEPVVRLDRTTAAIS
jgi:hypothetical protein